MENSEESGLWMLSLMNAHAAMENNTWWPFKGMDLTITAGLHGMNYWRTKCWIVGKLNWSDISLSSCSTAHDLFHHSQFLSFQMVIFLWSICFLLLTIPPLCKFEWGGVQACQLVPTCFFCLPLFHAYMHVPLPCVSLLLILWATQAQSSVHHVDYFLFFEQHRNILSSVLGVP